MLARLGIRQKLSLLLTLPLIAVLVTTLPFVAERIDDARAAAATARAAQAARDLGVLIQDLQQERLLALGYLATRQLDPGALVTQVQSVTDDAERLRDESETGTVIARADPALTALDDVRARVFARTAGAAEVYLVYRTAVGALLDALNLGNLHDIDLAGTGRLAALDALVRANEEAGSIGAALVARAADPGVDAYLRIALVAFDEQSRRFRQLGDPQHVALVEVVDKGQAATRIRQFAAAGATGGPSLPAQAFTAAVSYSGLRQIAEDRIARDIADAAQGRAADARGAASGVGGGGLLLFVLVVGLSTAVSRSISFPLRRLSRAAGRVADLGSAELERVADTDEAQPAPPRLAGVEIGTADEVGDLATALNRVQATAALLLERQVSTRRNMSVMFANVARRTQTLVGRQLMLIDELERTEQNPEELERLYRLDHIATRLRRSAEALLVIAGNRDHDGADVPVPLADVIRSAAAEIEGYRSVRLGAVPDLRVVVELVPDLRLVLAELLENATSFSAPGAMVDVSAELREHCVISVVDHGIGMAPARFAEENRRLVDRERLDVAPTKVLGLFVVGRLARRHGLTVRLHPTSGQGVTATVAVPARLLIRGAAATGVIYRARTRPAGVLTAAPESFSWFAPTPAHGNLVLPGPALADVSAELSAGSGPAVTTAASPDATPSGSGDAGPRRGLNKRQPGESLPTFGARADPVPAVGVRDPDGERDAVNAFVDGITRAAEEPAVPQPAVPQPAAAAAPAAPVERVEPPPVTRPMTGPATTRNGLTRRVPGANLGDHARMLARPPADDPPRERDADAERDALVAFLDGLARALPSEPTTGD